MGNAKKSGGWKDLFKGAEYWGISILITNPDVILSNVGAGERVGKRGKRLVNQDRPMRKTPNES